MVDMSKQTGLEFDPQYHPNWDEFCQRRTERLAAHTTKSILPPGFPHTIDSEMSWDGTCLDPSRYVLNLSEAELDDIDQAGLEYSHSGKALSEIERENFRIPLSLSDKLIARRHSLHHGTGILLLRGLCPDKRSQRENFVIFAGLTSHLSERRGRQSGGKYLVHIVDLTAERNWNTSLPAPYCNHDLPFHTDVGDLVAMYVLAPATDGGDGTFASVATIYNKLATSSADLLSVLAQPNWPFDRPPDRNETSFRRPVMFMNNGQPEMAFSRGALIRSPRGQRPLGLPKLTRIQSEALDAVHFAALESAHRVKYQSGDMIIFNNRKILHGRDSFTDIGDAQPRRHMIRLWLQDESLAGKPPNCLEKVWGKAFTISKNTSEDKEWPHQPEPS